VEKGWKYDAFLSAFPLKKNERQRSSKEKKKTKSWGFSC